jgi:4'-phosphopantetheinyl transferase
VEPSVVVHVRWAHTDDLVDRHTELLDDHERERLARLRQRGDRDRFVLGAAVLRGLVADLEQTEPRLVALDRTCPKCGAQHGPVSTPGRPWHCSVSHSGPFAVATVVAAHAASTVGVDLETTCPPDWQALLADVMAPGEPAPADEAAFLHTWTRKEAVVKATREGLSRPLSSVDLAAPPAQLRVVDLDVSELGATGPIAAALAFDCPARVELLRARL